MSKLDSPRNEPAAGVGGGAGTPRRPAHSLADLVPEDPRGVRLTPQLWDRLMAMAAAGHAVIAEFSWSTLHLWCRADLCRVYRIGQYLIVPLGAGPDHVMVIAMPGAKLTPTVRASLMGLMTRHELRYIPEETAEPLRAVVEAAGGRLVSVRDDADYLLPAQRIANLEEPGNGSHGQAVRRFENRLGLRTHPARAIIRDGLLSESEAFRHLLETHKIWRRKFGGSPPPAAVEEELRGIESWPRAAHGQRLRVFCLSVDGRPAGASVIEPMWGATWMGLVFKADHAREGTAEYLRRHVARQAVIELGPKAVLDIQQDNGVPQLRVMKESYKHGVLREKFAVVMPGREPSFSQEAS